MLSAKILSGTPKNAASREKEIKIVNNINPGLNWLKKITNNCAIRMYSIIR